MPCFVIVHSSQLLSAQYMYVFDHFRIESNLKIAKEMDICRGATAFYPLSLLCAILFYVDNVQLIGQINEIMHKQRYGNNSIKTAFPFAFFAFLFW